MHGALMLLLPMGEGQFKLKHPESFNVACGTSIFYPHLMMAVGFL